MERVRQLGKTVTVVHKHYQANGKQRFVEIIASPLLGTDGAFQGIIEFMRDITERKQAEESLAQQAQGADDDLDRFASKVVKSLQGFFEKLPLAEEDEPYIHQSSPKYG